MIVILIWAGAIGGLLFSVIDLAAKAGAWSADSWVLPAGVVCLAGAFLLSLIAARVP